MSVNQQVEWALREAEERIMQAVHNAGTEWNDVVDADGNDNVPDSPRQVLVFMCGDRKLTAKRPEDAGWGIRLGWFDSDRHIFHMGGSRQESQYVTHWREVPAPPEAAKD